MYGLVNKAVEDMVCTTFGEETWEEIKQRAGVDTDLFISMEAYPDDVTYKLVAAASELLHMPSDQILQAFGEYWVLYTAREGYGDMMKMTGSTFQEFLLNLDNLHSRVSLTFTHLKPPSFRCSDLTADSMRVHYYSGRTGLAPMVIGLLIGLGKTFGTHVQVSHNESREGGADHDEFLVTFHDI